MKIAATVVLYNPNSSLLENIKTYLDFCDKIYVMDNSDKEDGLKYILNFDAKIEYEAFGENKGIAFALKTACCKAYKDGYDLLLTMDQDSQFPIRDIDRVMEAFEHMTFDNIGIVCLNTLEFKPNYLDSPSYMDVDYWITSGNFIVLRNYFETDGFNESLFIDLVDFDLCYKLRNQGFRIVLLTKIYLIHQIGNPIKKRIFGKQFVSSNHDSIRYYYIYRNDYYLYKLDKKFFKEIHRNHKKDIIRMILLERNKVKKIKMIWRGIQDGKRNEFGKFKTKK